MFQSICRPSGNFIFTVCGYQPLSMFAPHECFKLLEMSRTGSINKFSRIRVNNKNCRTKMEGLGSVQNKVSCVFETVVLDEESRKREGQYYKVVASDVIKEKAIKSDIYNAKATEKLDGTCVLIAPFKDKPWLWARYDRKPNKNAEKRFRKYQQEKEQSSSKENNFTWNMAKDFKETPPCWIPASGVQIVDGSPVPDDIGHTPGWVPVSPTARQYCWHLSAIDLGQGLALVLREGEGSDHLFIDCVPLSELHGHTAELIGTNINGNPYGLGSKKHPIHLLVIHGSIQIKNPPSLDKHDIERWFRTDGRVEGVVWHCGNSSLFKVHRNHVMLSWPISEPSLTNRPIEVLVDTTRYENEFDNTVFVDMGKVCGYQCESLKGLVELVYPSEDDKGPTDIKGAGDSICQGDKKGVIYDKRAEVDT